MWGGKERSVLLCTVVALFELHACFFSFSCMVPYCTTNYIVRSPAVKCTWNGLGPTGPLLLKY